MIYHARIEVSLKPGHSDPEGDTTQESLRDLGYKVGEVKTGKVYELSIEAESPENAKTYLKEMCRRLLANPVKDNYEIKIVEEND